MFRLEVGRELPESSVGNVADVLESLDAIEAVENTHAGDGETVITFRVDETAERGRLAEEYPEKFADGFSDGVLEVLQGVGGDVAVEVNHLV